MTDRVAVDVRGITKHFGAVCACDGIDLTLRAGHVHGILGENGAGKSTLMKVLIGLVQPDAGTVSIGGRIVDIPDPVAAAGLGIAMVHQHLSLVDPLTVWENVALGDVARLDRAAMRARVAALGDHYGLAVDPDAVVGSLTAAVRQRVEIIKCLRRDPSVLIFDEPTSVLTPDESEQLFEALRRVVSEEGKAVALVSHKLDEITRATDEVTIMRLGAVVARMVTAEADAPSLARAMVGRPVSLRSERVALGIVDQATVGGRSGRRGDPAGQAGGRAEGPTVPPTGAPALELRGLTVRDRVGRPLLDALDLTVRPGEIVGLAGVEGNGQRPLADVLSSLVEPDRGRVVVDGGAVVLGRAGAMAAAGVALIPEDRHDSGVVLEMTVAENLFLDEPWAVARRGVLDRRLMRARAVELMSEFGIVAAGPDAPLWSLSGGNQQRVVVARELSRRPAVLVAVQPTRGLDVGAIEYMTDRLRAVADSGVGVLLISSELEEIVDLSDRVAVLFEGRIVGSMARADIDLEIIGLLMGGWAA